MYNIYKDLMDGLKTRDKVIMVTSLNSDIQKKLYVQADLFADQPEIVSEAYRKGEPVVDRENGELMIAEPFGKTERLIILGGGHISLALADFADKTGFTVVVADDRSAFASAGRFPEASEVICDEFEHAIPRLNICEKDYVAVVTRGHKCDRECLQKLAEEKPAKYVGLIGSKKRVAGLKSLLEEYGVSRTWLDAIHTPIGLNIGATTPEEIAVSIIAEIIQVKRMKPESEEKRMHSDIEMDVVEKLAQMSDEKKAIVTVIETKGSAPRKSGAKMIVYEDGSIFGTIGGGCLEEEMIHESLLVIKQGGYRVKEADLTNDVAASEGMVCGGTMTILIEAG